MNILITGASSGIGLATAEILAQKGHRLILLARRLDRLEKIKSQALDPQKITVIKADLGSVKETNQALETVSELSTVDVLINNAGLALGTETFQDMPEEDMMQMLNINVSALLRITKKILPFMVAKKSGHIINLGSVAGDTPYKGGTVYCATKAAVHMLSDSLRLDVGGLGIRVSTIAPGRVAETEFSKVRFKGDETKAQKVYEGYRVMTAKDVAETIVWVIERPAHVNVQEVVILPTDQPFATVLDPLR